MNDKLQRAFDLKKNSSVEEDMKSIIMFIEGCDCKNGNVINGVDEGESIRDGFINQIKVKYLR